MKWVLFDNYFENAQANAPELFRNASLLEWFDNFSAAIFFFPLCCSSGVIDDKTLFCLLLFFRYPNSNDTETLYSPREQ